MKSINRSNDIKARSSLLAMAVFFAATVQGSAASLQPNDDNTTTPIKHIIVIIGENHCIDDESADMERAGPFVRFSEVFGPVSPICARSGGA
jgi:hypothetical protein